MEIEVKTETINCLWEILQGAPDFWRPEQTERIFRKYLEQGWFFSSDVEDILFLLDDRLHDHRIHLEDLYKPLGVFFEDIVFRPKKISNVASLYKALRPEYFVLLLIQLERFGFSMEAERFVKILLPAVDIKSKSIFSNAELEIFWYSKYKNKSADIILYSTKPLWYSEPIKKHKTLNGFKTSYYQDDENEERQMLRIRAPKYRERSEPVFTKCQICGLEWYKGDPESSLYHRKEHKRRLTWIKPEPLPKMLIAFEKDGDDAERVTHSSPTWKHHEMYNRALAFKREFRYDFTQWSKKGPEDQESQGYLFTGDKGEIVGACAFRKRLQNDNTYRWGLQWIWICPDERGKGHLSKRWKMFRERFGDFHVEPPVSDAMKVFLEKKGDSGLMR
ncbi:hypothetical protein [Algoriphagus sp. NG3]|uniref:hypothetical protein n=1 Tax=Algoriphagus sp. NG3 TaxID=3097546 RepID=UPI002A839BEC|nr:hypothetical protein [Algoriphagus sp. NG3]WPR75223.1 hypothetical protein SLW71_21410 [Algoriphagus sp. NG3]